MCRQKEFLSQTKGLPHHDRHAIGSIHTHLHGFQRVGKFTTPLA